MTLMIYLFATVLAIPAEQRAALNSCHLAVDKLTESNMCLKSYVDSINKFEYNSAKTQSQKFCSPSCQGPLQTAFTSLINSCAQAKFPRNIYSVNSTDAFLWFQSSLYATICSQKENTNDNCAADALQTLDSAKAFDQKITSDYFDGPIRVFALMGFANYFEPERLPQIPQEHSCSYCGKKLIDFTVNSLDKFLPFWNQTHQLYSIAKNTVTQNSQLMSAKCISPVSSASRIKFF